MATDTPHSSQRPHLAAVVEDRFHAVVGWVLGRAGWRPRLETYTGYGTPDRVRVLARVLLSPPRRGAGSDRGAGADPVGADPVGSDPVASDPVVSDAAGRRRAGRRGFRHFLTAPAPSCRVRIEVGGRTAVVTSDRSGYVDVELPVDVPLRAGWQSAVLTCLDGAEPVEVDAPLLVLDERTRYGVVSDVDDTIMVTAVPRPLLAAWNTFVRHSSARRAVPGMPELYRKVQQAHPDAVFFYLSTGAWNMAGTLREFLARHAYPRGPLLLTDWGPTRTGWFRSGRAHKESSLEQLMSWFPQVRWVLFGDDGQHDVEIYEQAARRRPDRVRVVAIRRLTGGQQVLAGNAPNAGVAADGPDLAQVPTVAGLDGDELAGRLATVPGVLRP